MLTVRQVKPLRMVSRLLLAATMAVPSLAFGQAATTPSDSSMVNLVRLLIEQKVISAEKGAALMAQAEAEAQKARAATQQAQAEMPAAAPGTIRVPYVPETVRAQIKDELKAEVLAQAKTEGWAAPGDASPDWVKRIKLTGDVRIRSQSSLYSKNNSNQIPDFARINQLGPIPILDRGYFIPLLNSTVDRANRLEVRARLGVEANIAPWINAGVVIATGNDNSPISTNQNLGGGLAKRDIWLDQAYINVHPEEWANVSLGRFKNPFLSTELLFDEDLRFDGVAARVDAGRFIGDDITLSVRGGAFPLDYGDPNFPQNDVTKLRAPERWLYSGQIELGAKFGEGSSVTLGAAYHDFTHQRANLSDPCFLYRLQTEFRAGVICSTDNERALFLRKGNTVAPIRNVVLDVPAPAVNETRVSPQFVGRTFNFRILNLTAQAIVKVNDDLTVTLNGDYVRNLAFKRSQLCRYSPAVSEAFPPLNNVKPVAQGDTGDGNVCSQTNPSAFVGGNEGYMGVFTLDHGKLFTKGGWQAKISYRYLESDAVLDSYTDSRFHLGGTNAKGYTIGAKASLFDNMTIGAKWLSADEVSGEPFAIDVLQADLEVAF